jgi:hypothetical protein
MLTPKGAISMDKDQVWARIIEVGKAIKRTLIKKRIRPKYEDRGYKFIDDVHTHLHRLYWSFNLLNPREGSSVFEIGPGHCYLLFMCRELRGCRVAGVDVMRGEAIGYRKQARYIYRLFRQHFGLQDTVKHHGVAKFKPIPFGGRYDYIVATRAVFNGGWREQEYRFWLTDCYNHLRPEGKLMIHFNKIRPDALEAVPLLRPLYAPAKVKKLSVISRETIGQLLGAKV